MEFFSIVLLSGRVYRGAGVCNGGRMRRPGHRLLCAVPEDDYFRRVGGALLGHALERLGADCAGRARPQVVDLRRPALPLHRSAANDVLELALLLTYLVEELHMAVSIYNH